MDIFKFAKEFTKKVSEVENSIYNEKQDYLEIYERNQELEKAIAQRTEELNNANKRMFTLQHILNMMNSTTPVETVLGAIVNSTQGELDYKFCTVLKKEHDEDGKFIKMMAYSNGAIIDELNGLIGLPFLHSRRLNYSDASIFYDTIKQKSIQVTKSFGSVITSLLSDVEESILHEFIKKKVVKSVIVIPLFSQEKEYGWFCVFSAREELAPTELDYLNLYAKQVEMAITIADLFQTVRSQAVTDALTGLYNRRYFEEALQKEVQRAKRQQQPFSVIGIDLDFLKKINDTYGHNFGDLAITTIANVLKKNARSVDVPARIGGEEFNVLLPGVSSEGAMIAAERIRKSIEAVEIDTIGHITGSLGVATFIEHTQNIDELLELTDQAMYQSKRNGRNRVTLANNILETSWQDIAVNTFVDILSKNKIPKVQNLSTELCEKLNLVKNKEDYSNDILFTVTDTLVKMYNPMHSEGGVKAKINMAVVLAKRFDLSKEETDKLRIAILLYDIGNLLLPEELLQKTTPLTEDEKTRIKSHPVIAAREILEPISSLKDILPIIEHHHENWDGTGYPKNISKEEIPLISQIILILDEYFALIEPRPYRAKLSVKDALEIIKAETKKKWNENLVSEFVSLIGQDMV